VANTVSDTVSMYAINPGTGALTSLGRVNAGWKPVAVTVDPGGKFAYVVDQGDYDVSVYDINASSGALTFTGLMATGATPVAIAILGQ
jgi:6-phosphogluconolactonase (cycloisomerase 2 family)